MAPLSIRKGLDGGLAPRPRREALDMASIVVQKVCRCGRVQLCPLISVTSSKRTILCSSSSLSFIFLTIT
jgi:hypothetical protein